MSQHPSDHAFVADSADVSMCGFCGWDEWEATQPDDDPAPLADSPVPAEPRSGVHFDIQIDLAPSGWYQLACEKLNIHAANPTLEGLMAEFMQHFKFFHALYAKAKDDDLIGLAIDLKAEYCRHPAPTLMQRTSGEAGLVLADMTIERDGASFVIRGNPADGMPIIITPAEVRQLREYLAPEPPAPDVLLREAPAPHAIPYPGEPGKWICAECTCNLFASQAWACPNRYCKSNLQSQNGEASDPTNPNPLPASPLMREGE